MAAEGDPFISPENDPRLAFPTAPIGIINHDDILNWIVDLRDPGKRPLAMMEIGRRRDCVPQLAVWIWHSYGTMAILMQEVFAIATSFAEGTLSAAESNRVCNALALCNVWLDIEKLAPLESKYPAFSPSFLKPFADNETNGISSSDGAWSNRRSY